MSWFWGITGSSWRIRYLPLEDVKQRYHRVKQVFDDWHDIREEINRLDGNLLQIRPMLPRQANEFMTYPNAERKAARTPEADRVFPVDTVTIQQFRTEHDTDLEEATIHTGFYANELARSYNALALTVGSDIYFRDSSYNPGSEEGRKTLAHELTHVSQYQNEKLTGDRTLEAVEAEAEQAERKEVSDKDGIISITLRGRRYMIPKSEKKYYVKKAAESISDWMREQKIILEDDEYCKLKNAYDEWLWS